MTERMGSGVQAPRRRLSRVAVSVVKGGASSFLIKVSRTVLAVLLSVVLARSLGASGYGVYAYVFAIVSILSAPAQFGLPTLLIRETAKGCVEDRYDYVKGLWRWAFGFSGMLAVVAIAAVGVVLWVWSDRLEAEQFQTVAWALLLMPLIVFGKLRDAALQGLHKVIQGQLSDSVIRPVVFISLVASFLLFGAPLSPQSAMALHVGAAVVAFAAGSYLLYRSRPSPMREGCGTRYESSSWLRSVLPLASISGLQMINREADILMIGIFSTSAEVGIYRVVSQGALLVAFVLHAISLVVAPRFANMFAAGREEELKHLVAVSSACIFLATIPPFFIYLFWGEEILRLLFGAEFSVGHSSLVVLCAGYLLSSSFGAIGFLLTMTGHEKQTAQRLAASGGLNIVLNLALIPPYGMLGAALATATSTFVWNLLFWRVALKRLGIDSFFLRALIPGRRAA